MTKEVSVVAHGAVNTENALEYSAEGVGKALLRFVTSTVGTAREWAEQRAKEKRRRQTELLLNSLPAATRRDVNWPARRSEIFPDESRKVFW